MSRYQASPLRRSIRTRRRWGGLSGLGLLLVLIGLAYLLVASHLLPRATLGWWPLVVVAVGIFGLLRRPGWVTELDIQLPGFGAVADRPRRWFSFALVAGGGFLLPFTTHLLDERLIGPIVLVMLGAALIWRRGTR